MDTQAQQLADYATGLTHEELTDDELHAIKRRLVDSLACALAALPTAPVSTARALAGKATGDPPAPVMLTGER